MIVNDAKLPEKLAHRLQRPLPGAEAQRVFEPELSYGRQFAPAPHDARQAAVVVMLYPERDPATAGEWKLPLTMRAAELPDHAGQISLPGGMLEEGEASSDAALRELDEELGVTCDEVQLLGQLTPLYVWISNFWVQPWLAVTAHEPVWQANPAEVAALISLPLADLINRRNVDTMSHKRRGLRFRSPCLKTGPYSVWGATSMILGEVRSIIDDVAI